MGLLRLGRPELIPTGRTDCSTKAIDILTNNKYIVCFGHITVSNLAYLQICCDLKEYLNGSELLVT